MSVTAPAASPLVTKLQLRDPRNEAPLHERPARAASSGEQRKIGDGRGFKLGRIDTGIGRTLLTLVLLSIPLPSRATPDAPDRESRPCADCHAAIVQTFAATRMAQSAAGKVFSQEWAEQGSPTACLTCHAPSGGDGLTCADCHGGAGHPYPRLQVPDICARCHDAPGESTVRRFRERPAALQGKDCLDCHLPPGGAKVGHGFLGPSAPGFLDGVARLRLSLREDPDAGTLVLIQISHRAGHALPGGTTGRAVWLVVSGLDAEGSQVWQETTRFGWERHGENDWRDRTLPPGPPTLVEIAVPTHTEATRLRAELWYRFAAGDLNEPDARARRLDAVELGGVRRLTGGAVGDRLIAKLSLASRFRVPSGYKCPIRSRHFIYREARARIRRNAQHLAGGSPMEAFKLKTLDDLLDAPEERIELIDGDIAQRPMARMEHGLAQHRASVELGPFDHPSGPGGWWIASEVSVHYSTHQCPTHDLAGWRKERLPERPRGVVEITPDWVCEIVSPGHERKDTLTLFLLLQRHQVPYYWIIWPEDRALVAWQLDGGSYRTIASVAAPGPEEQRMRIPPCDAIEIDLGYILGDDA